MKFMLTSSGVKDIRNKAKALLPNEDPVEVTKLIGIRIGDELIPQPP